jgi:hypothetical protein
MTGRTPSAVVTSETMRQVARATAETLTDLFNASFELLRRGGPPDAVGSVDEREMQ